MQKRKEELKISTVEKQRLHKRKEIVKSLKFLRFLGHKIKNDL